MKTIEEIQDFVYEIFEKEIFVKPPFSLYEPIEYAMKQGGKRLRPLILLIAIDMFQKELREGTNAAIAIELLHNFTLLHDDIMDKSPIRRGNATVYKKFGDNTAILSGDTMFAMAYNELAKYDARQVPWLVKAMNTASIRVCQGQAMDMDFEKRDSVSLMEYISMIRAKTGALFACSLRLGAIIAGVDRDLHKIVAQTGQIFGEKFQIIDDILDCYGDENMFGKKTGQDIENNKKTFLYVTAFEEADTNNKQELIRLFKEESDVEQKKQGVLAIYDRVNVLQKSVEHLQNLNNELNLHYSFIESYGYDPANLKTLISLLDTRIK